MNKKDELAKEMLLQKYPDMVVVALKATDPKLYAVVRYRASVYGITSLEYLTMLGFASLTTGDYTDSGNRKALLKLYPDGIVIGLPQKDKHLSAKIHANADKRNLDTHDYIRYLGFIYNASDNSTEARYVQRLLTLYPDKVVYKLYAKDSALCESIINYANIRGINLVSYLEGLGFTYNPRGEDSRLSNRKKPRLTEEFNIADLGSVISELLKHYPDRRVTQLYSRDSGLYNEICRLSNKTGKTPIACIKLMGFSASRLKD